MTWNEERAATLFQGRRVWVKGTFHTWDREVLRRHVIAAGARYLRSPELDPDFVLSGMGWEEGLRGVIGRGAAVWTEGQLLLHMEGTHSFPSPADIPHPNNLMGRDVLEEGELRLNTPGEHSGPLTLRWKRVAFEPHRRFLELFGFEFAGPGQYLGQLFYNGEPLQPTDGSLHCFCAARFVHSPAKGNGSELNERSLELPDDGKHGFNCTPLMTRGAEPVLPWASGWPTGWKADIINRKPRSFGDLSVHSLQDCYWVDLDQGLWKVNYYAAGTIIDPKNPYNR